MAKQESHDIREYYIMVTNIDLNTAADTTVAVVPIPVSAQVIRMIAVAETVVNNSTNITLELNSLKLRENGATRNLTVLSTDAVGTVRAAEYTPILGRNQALEGEDGDALAAAASLELISGGEATVTNSYTFVITLRA